MPTGAFCRWRGCGVWEYLLELLIDDPDAEHLLADKGYDVDALVKLAVLAGLSVFMPPKRNRKVQRKYDQDLYELRHLVENAFMVLKQWRGIATRYAKNASSFLAAVHIRCIAICAKIYLRYYLGMHTQV